MNYKIFETPNNYLKAKKRNTIYLKILFKEILIEIKISLFLVNITPNNYLKAKNETPFIYQYYLKKYSMRLKSHYS